MVNSGGPSKGCLTCIQRKIRCDRGSPVCGQCVKSKRQCRGYRNAAGWIFRDQTQSVAIRTLEPRKTTPASESSTTEAGSSSTDSVSDESTTIPSLKLDEETGLTLFFINNFTCNNFRPGTNIYWIPNNFPDLLKHDCTRLSVQSAGAMALARLQKSPYYHREAQKNYGMALLSLSELGRQQSDMDKDHVLFTIMFLSLFEILASYGPDSRQSWLTHLKGLGLLLGRRPDRFLRSGMGIRLMFQGRVQAIMDALRYGTPVAEIYQKGLPPLPFAIPPHLVQSNNADIMMIRLATLQAQCRSLEPSYTLVAELMTLGEDFSSWMTDVPEFYTFSPQPNNYHSGLWWDARYDIYPAPTFAHVWNKVRSSWIFTEDLIQDQLLRLSLLETDSTSLLTSRTRSQLHGPEIRRLVTDICATIPPYYRPPSGFGGSHAAGIPPLLGTTYWLLHPIEVVGCMREAPLELTEWLLKCLDRMYATTGIEKAEVAAGLLRTRQKSLGLV